MQIWSYIFSQNSSETVIGLFIFFTSVATILFSIALSIVYKTKFDIEYLGWCMLMESVWMIGESKVRQLLVPNATGLAASCFIMIMLCPLPDLLIYQQSSARKIQKDLSLDLFCCFFEFYHQYYPSYCWNC